MRYIQELASAKGMTSVSIVVSLLGNKESMSSFV